MAIQFNTHKSIGAHTAAVSYTGNKKQYYLAENSWSKPCLGCHIYV